MEYPDVPYILLGHSMGSFMVRTLLAKYPKSGVSAVILSGTGWMHRGIINSGIAAATLVAKRIGADKPSKLISDMMFGSYNRKIRHQRTAFDWLTRDHRIVDAYVADPLCGFTMTAGLAKEMLTGLLYIQEPEHMAKMRKDLPIFFIAGAEDPVGNYGEGVKQTVQAFLKAGMKNVSMRLYPLCRHEVLNELNREEVYGNILDWLKKQGFYA
jgi:alpha-beta hydrolase superfamily lysophospholipase